MSTLRVTGLESAGFDPCRGGGHVHAHLVRAFLGALAAGVFPGYFWARFLCPASGLGERLAYSIVLSMASVPAIALMLARIAGTGITLWVAVASVVIVAGSGAVAFSARGPAPGLAGPVL